MLPEPISSFTIPSIADGTELECRLYHPPECARLTDIRRGAIVAHPYAPLGGCFDDPVVLSIAEQILSHGYVVGTFNFRGAGASKGHTSWTSKPEQSDYVSFVGFMAIYLDALHRPSQSRYQPSESPASATYPPSPAPLLSPDSAHFPPTPASPSPSPSSPSSYHSPHLAHTPLPIDLILAGYSYGSLIASSVSSPSKVTAVLSQQFSEQTTTMTTTTTTTKTTELGSPKAEIRARATHLAREHFLGSAAYAVGSGTESPSRLRSRRSLDVAVRRSLDRSRAMLGKGKAGRHHGAIHASEAVAATAEDTSGEGGGRSREGGKKDEKGREEEIMQQSPGLPVKAPLPLMPRVRTSFLLISPLLPPVSSLLSLSAKQWSFPLPSWMRHFKGGNKHEATGDEHHHHHRNLHHRQHHQRKQQPNSHSSASEPKEQQEGPEESASNYHDAKYSQLCENPTLAVYGDGDIFTSRDKLRRWATELKGREGSRFDAVEVCGAGHFWIETGAETRLREAVGSWVSELDNL